jgi:acetyltransferase-like isoleucine patch superfamily enzyme
MFGFASSKKAIEMNESDFQEKSFSNKAKVDFAGYFFYKIHYLHLLVMERFYTTLNRILLRIKGIHLGKKTSFIGMPFFMRFPLSTIHIGANCTFRSDKISNKIGVNRHCLISTHSNTAEIHIGEGCGLSGVTVGAYKSIVIGKNVLCGANSLITDFDWHETVYPSEPKTVIIHDNVWLGVNTVVLKGVEIGENSIIGANSVVVKSIPANVIAAGNPCKVIKQLNLNAE